jgi:Flp pilus assembly protein TadD
LTRLALVMALAGISACSTSGAGRAPDAAPGMTADPEVTARYGEAVSAAKAGDDASAAASFAAISAAHPELAGPLLNQAQIRLRQGDEAGARSLLEQASRVCTRCGPVWNELGILDRQQGRFADAERDYQQAIQVEPDYALPYYNLAVLYELYIQRPDLALDNYQRYLTLASGEDSAEVKKWLADLQRRAGATPVAARADGAT